MNQPAPKVRAVEGLLVLVAFFVVMVLSAHGKMTAGNTLLPKTVSVPAFHTLVWSNSANWQDFVTMGWLVEVKQSGVLPPKWTVIGATATNRFPIYATNRQGFFTIGLTNTNLGIEL